MKLFGEHLIEAGLIREEDLVKAILRQLEQAPNPAQIAFESGLLSSGELLKVFKFQHLNQSEFRPACAALGLWTPALEATVINVTKEKRLPIGRLLIEDGVLQETQLSQALQDYVGAEVPPRIPTPSSHAVGDRELLIFAFDMNRLERLELLLIQMGINGDLLEEESFRLRAELELMHGAAFFAEQPLLQFLIHSALRLHEKRDPPKNQLASILLKAGMDLGTHLAGGGDEASWWKSKCNEYENALLKFEEAA